MPQTPPKDLERAKDPPPATTAGEITQLLDAWSRGDPQALDQILPLAFGDLRRIARKCSGRIPCHDLQPTELIGEIYATLRKQRKVNLEHRGQFYSFAALLMERVLLDYKRNLLTRKRGGHTLRVSLIEALDLAAAADASSLSAAVSSSEVLDAIDKAADIAENLKQLAELDPQQAEVARLRYLIGLTIAETAEALGVSVMTVNRKWKNAKRFLSLELAGYAGENPARD